MKHWDLIPGERVTLMPGTAECPDERGIGATFCFRTTACAFFEFGDQLLELELDHDGYFRDSDGRRWHAHGANRGSRIVVVANLDEGPHFTRVTPRDLQR